MPQLLRGTVAGHGSPSPEGLLFLGSRSRSAAVTKAMQQVDTVIQSQVCFRDESCCGVIDPQHRRHHHHHPLKRGAASGQHSRRCSGRFLSPAPR